MTRTLGHIIADFETSLASKISVGATSVSLLSNIDKDGTTLPNGQYLFTISGNDSTKEYIQGTLTGTVVTNIKSVSRQGVLTTGVLREHRKMSSVIISDFPDILFLNNLLDGTTSLDSLTPLKYDGNPTINDDAQITTKSKIDALSFANPIADATIAVYGISKQTGSISTTFLGDNDSRVPTQGQNDALIGSYGTANISNPFVTATDPAFTGTVKLTTDQSIGGIKTFSSIPISSAGVPTTANQLATKGYIDSL